MGARPLSPVPVVRARSRWGGPRLARAVQGAFAARPMGAAAIRIPERVNAQLALVVPASHPRIFVHEGARQALERRLMNAFPGPVLLSITDNRHSIISHSLKGGVLRVRLHHMFLDAPPSVLGALVRYVTRGDRDASLFVGRYIEANGSRLARRSRGVPLHARGKHHDLLAIFRDLNERYFDGEVNALITWGKRGSKRGEARATIKLGSYSALDRLIRVHPALDRRWVPRYFVAYVVYHEMLHHVVPSSRGAGRRLLHPPEFLARERGFRQYERALAWERQKIGRLLRA
jgi:hypothetical protein